MVGRELGKSGTDWRAQLEYHSSTLDHRPSKNQFTTTTLLPTIYMASISDFARNCPISVDLSWPNSYHHTIIVYLYGLDTYQTLRDELPILQEFISEWERTRRSHVYALLIT